MRRLSLPLRKDLVRALIAERFGSVDALVAEWEQRWQSGVLRVGKPRERPTVYRWLDKGLPSYKEDIFAFAGILDVDPISLMNLDQGAIDRYFQSERPRVSLETLSHRNLTAFWSLYAPGPAWPAAEIAQNYFGRSWCTHEFQHDHSIATNAYVLVQIRSYLESETVAPRAYHFAYRRTGARDGMWRPYGTIIGYSDEACLVSESGDFQQLTTVRANHCLAIETYFGAGPAEFKVAALHDFDLSIDVATGGPTHLRFWG